MYQIHTNRLKDHDFLQLTSCPACYGRKICNDFHSGAIKFTGFSRVPSLHFLNIKNVHRATLKEEKVILKKLAYDTELLKIDDKICKITGQRDGCHSGDALFRHSFDAGEVLHPATVKGLSDLVMCPSPRLLQRIEERFSEREEYLLHSEKLMIYTTLSINPEPIVIQIFPSKEGWPFAEYIGACGRWVVEEEIPHTLNSFINADWKKRVSLAKQILQIADKFTNNTDDYALYWTDVDYDNYGVKDDGTVIIVDAENIVVVDQQKVKADKPIGYNSPHYSPYDACIQGHSCLSYRPYDLCSHVTADLNYYAVCRGILAPDAFSKERANLLHDIPGWVDHQYELSRLLTECSRPSTPNGRILAKDKLLNVLEELEAVLPL